MEEKLQKIFATARVAELLGAKAPSKEDEKVLFIWKTCMASSIHLSLEEGLKKIKILGEPHEVYLNGITIPWRDPADLSLKDKEQLLILIESARKYNFLAKEASEDEAGAFYEKKAQILHRICGEFSYNVEFPYYIKSENSYYDLYEIAVRINKKTILCVHLPAEVVDGWELSIHPVREISRNDWETNRRRREELLKELNEAL